MLSNKYIKTFIDEIIEEKGFDTSNSGYINKVRQNIENTVADTIDAAILTNLPKDKLSDFENLLDKEATDEEIKSFINTNIPNIDFVIGQALAEFKDIYLNN